MDKTNKILKKFKKWSKKGKILNKSSEFRYYSSLGPEVRNVKFCIGPTAEVLNSSKFQLRVTVDREIMALISHL